MLMIFGLLIAGMLLGFLLRSKKRIIEYAGKLTNWTIYLLLLLLGISVGSNEKIINNISTIGINAIILALGSVIGSVAISYIVYLFCFKKRENEK